MAGMQFPLTGILCAMLLGMACQVSLLRKNRKRFDTQTYLAFVASSTRELGGWGVLQSTPTTTCHTIVDGSNVSVAEVLANIIALSACPAAP
jgi:hypothetical protein